jgi:hypothetical protein
MRKLSLFLILSVLLGTPAGSSAAELTAAMVTELFSGRDNEEGREFSPADVTTVPGSFTTAGRNEAIISFSDTNQSSGSGPAEIWLLRCGDERWRPILKITESDGADFSTADVNGDGALEVVTHTTCGSGGTLIINRRLLYFVDERSTELLTFEGFYNTGWPDKGICAFDACFAFRDVDRDGILEVELTEFYDYCRKEANSSVFERRSVRTTLFRPVISPSGSIIGIER